MPPMLTNDCIDSRYMLDPSILTALVLSFVETMDFPESVYVCLFSCVYFKKGNFKQTYLTSYICPLTHNSLGHLSCLLKKNQTTNFYTHIKQAMEKSISFFAYFKTRFILCLHFKDMFPV